jgi:hypothetical protein
MNHINSRRAMARLSIGRSNTPPDRLGSQSSVPVTSAGIKDRESLGLA